jgi:ribose transport system substrate-binding protein
MLQVGEALVCPSRSAHLNRLDNSWISGRLRSILASARGPLTVKPMWMRGFSLVLLLAAGCGDSAPSPSPGTSPGTQTAGGKAPKLLFVTNSNSDWWNAVEKGMTDGGKDFECAPEMRRNNGEIQGQVEKLREALARPDIAGVAVSVLEADAEGILDAMRALKKAGKIVIAIDSDVVPTAADARDGYIGTNNIKAGEAAGRAAAVLRPEGGKVVAFVGTSSAANARERSDGFFHGAGTKFIKVETSEDGGDHGRAASNVKTALIKTPDLGVLLGLWSYNAPAIAEQVRKDPAVRKRTTVVTFDLDEGAVVDISDGMIDASVCQNPYEMGYQGVKLLKALINKDAKTVKDILPDGKTRDTGVRVIVPKGDSAVIKEGKAKGDEVITIEEMKSWLASKGLKSS